jgi:O-antigen ligase/polysaccharide polymerase Wzy-like membrane protein
MRAPEASPATGGVHAGPAAAAPSSAHAAVPAAGPAWLPVSRDRAARLEGLCRQAIVGLLMVLIIVLPFARARWTRSALLVAAAACWAARWALGGRPLWRRTPLDWPIACFATWALLSAMASVRPLYSLEKFGQEPLTYFGLLYLVLVHVRSEGEHRRILGMLAMGLAILAGYGLWEWSRPWHSPWVYIRSFTAGGTYIGAYLAAAVPMAASQTVVGGSLRRGWWWLVMCLGLLCLVPTFSRAAWAGAGIALIFLAVTTARWLWAPLLAAAAAAPLLFGQFVVPRFLQLVSPARILAETSTMDRLPIWRYALARMLDHPLLGFGFGRQVPAVVLREGYASGDLVLRGAPLGYAHNSFLDIGLQMGFVGLALLLWLLGAILAALWRAWRAAPPGYPRAATAGVLAVALAFPLRAMTNNYFTDDPVILLWFLIALALTTGPSSESRVASLNVGKAGAGAEAPITRNPEPGTAERGTM